LGAFLRIDLEHPDPGWSYGIPRDTPFVGRPDARGEVWAYGLRNPWRLAVDLPTGQVWVGNHGQDLWETVHQVRAGENYGWSVYEGSHLFYRHRRRGPTPPVAPTFEHHHHEARSLTGGIVYRGGRLPGLEGAYVYGDHSTGRLWGGRHDGSRVVWHRELAATPLQITAFGQSPAGDLLIADLGSGLHRLVPAPPSAAPAASFPRRLSDTGLFASTRDHQPAPGVVAYSVNVPGWADGAQAEHFLALPGEARITHAASRGWGFPDGAVLVQTLGFAGPADAPGPGRRIETRLLTRQDGRWAGYSYRWNPEQTDAELVGAAGAEAEVSRAAADAPAGHRLQRWRFPSRAECLACHSRAAGFVLGMSDLQMNRDHAYPGGIRDNQLRALEHAGYFTAALPPPAPEPGRGRGRGRLVDPHEPGAPLEDRVRSYLHANCAVCHVEAGGGNARMQLEFTTPRDMMELVGARPQHDTFGLREAMLVAPGHPGRSVLLERLSRRGRGQMPPLVSQQVDDRAVALVRDWIASLPAEPSPRHRWQPADFAAELDPLPPGRSRAAGQALFRDLGCLQCHRLG
ncbi:MAG: PQQ-dependent sugar dehydrogenase, partial [Verrucomicrobiota bacterium]